MDEKVDSNRLWFCDNCKNVIDTILDKPMYGVCPACHSDRVRPYRGTMCSAGVCEYCRRTFFRQWEGQLTCSFQCATKALVDALAVTKEILDQIREGKENEEAG